MEKVMTNAMAKAEMAEVLYQRGEMAFAKGKYQETIDVLTKCLSMEKAEEYRYIDIAHSIVISFQ